MAKKKPQARKKKRKIDMDKVMKGVGFGLSLYKAYKQVKR